MQIVTRRVIIMIWVAGIACSWLFGFIAGMFFDYLTYPARVPFAVWFRAAPVDLISANFIAAMAVLLFISVRLSRSN